MHFSKNQHLLCRLFLSYPKRAFYMQEIGRILQKKPGVFQKTLNNLEKEGFVESEFQANARFFKLNDSYPLLKEVLSIIKKTSPEINTFKQIIAEKDKKRKKNKKIKQNINEDISYNTDIKNNNEENKVKAFPTKLSDLQEEKPLTSLRPHYTSNIETSFINKEEKKVKTEKANEKSAEKNVKEKTIQKNISQKKEQLELF